MVNVSLQFLNLISPSKVKHMLQNSELPSGKSSINHILSHSYAQITNNDALKTALNPYNVPVQQMQSKAVDVIYTEVKDKNISLNSYLDGDLPIGATKLCTIHLDQSKSIYYSDGIYNNNTFMRTYINIFNTHPCKVQRVGNGKICVTHITHSPPIQNDFNYISGVDVANYNRAQFLSRRSFEFDENMVVYIKEYRPYNCNMQVYDSIVNNNYEVHKFSEKSVFHQAGLKKYDNNLFSEVEADLVINIDEAMELIRPFY